MFSLQFDRDTASLLSVVLQPGYDWETLLNELARLERATLEGIVFGKQRAEPLA
jgi:hypothetical protein